MKRVRTAGWLLASLIMMAGCRLDMHTQPKILPLTHSDFFEDGRGSRALVAGTVARGQLRDDSYLYTGMIGGKPGDMMPFPATKEVLERGRERFNIYCAPCHSRVGDGNGMIVQRGFRHPPSFHSPTLRSAPLGHFFDVMTNGFGAMPDYSAQVQARDRWAIASYIRVLQLSQNASGADAQGLDMSAKPPAESTPGSGATLPLPANSGEKKK